MIYIVCSCGKSLQAEDEEERRGFPCPGCGRQVGGRATRKSRKASASLRPLAWEDAPAQLLVPQWEETKADKRDAARYRLATPVEEAGLPADKEAPRKRKSLPRRRQRGAGEGGLDLFVPFRDGKPLFLLSILLACVLGLLLNQLARNGTLLEGGPEGLQIAGILLVLAGVQVGCWYRMLSALMAGECDLISWDGRGLLRILKGMAYGLACFLAGPAWLFLVAGLFWLHGGDLTWLDWLLLGELVAVAVAYWLFCTLAVASDQRLSSANPFRVVALVRLLGVPTVAIAACLAGGGAILHGYLLWTSLLAMHEAVSAWLWLLFTFLSAQACSTYLLLWLGIRCSALLREQRSRPVTTEAPDQVERPA